MVLIVLLRESSVSGYVWFLLGVFVLLSASTSSFQALIFVFFSVAIQTKHIILIQFNFHPLFDSLLPHNSSLCFQITDRVVAVLSAVIGTRRQSVTVLHVLGSQT